MSKAIVIGFLIIFVFVLNQFKNRKFRSSTLLGGKNHPKKQTTRVDLLRTSNKLQQTNKKKKLKSFEIISGY